MKHLTFRVLAVCISLAATLFSLHAHADVVTDWNLIAVKTVKAEGLNSNLASRIIAIEAIAMWDAANVIKKTGTAYHYQQVATAPASAQAAISQAAHDVLLYYFPNQKLHLDSLLSASLTTAGDGPIDAGQKIGAAAAADIIAYRQHDGAEQPNASYPGPKTPKARDWRPTPPAFAPDINQQWLSIKPFILDSTRQFRPGPPPASDQETFKSTLAAVSEIGSVKSTARTEEQTHVAQFYKQDAELTVNEIARELAIAHQLPVEENALVFALVDIAEADARISVWDAKYYFLFWRPVTALNADTDGTVTNNYGSWTPLIPTPPHPSYPSGHSGTVTAGLEVLKHFFGDNNTLTLHTTTAGEAARTVHSLSDIESENGLSRIYGGIHYAFDNTIGQDIGKKVAAYVIANGPHKTK